MREIKFRAWNPNTKEFDSSFQLLLEQDISNGFGAEKIIGVDDCIFEERLIKDGAAIQQYTGLKDKHGVEIYEGDILWHAVEIVETDGSVDVAESYYEVLFKRGCFLTRTLDGRYPEYETFTERFSIGDGVNILSDGEVIGNIYDNPELLEAGDVP